MTGPIACNTSSTTPSGADPHRDLNGDGTEDECAAAGPGSRCDEFRQRCTLPFRQRTPKPIVWHYTQSSDPSYFEPTLEAARQWDVAMRGTVAVARYAECMRVVRDQEKCAASDPVYFGQQDQNDDAVALVAEVEHCRAQRAGSGADCDALADSIGTARGYEPAVIALAKQPPMVILCQSPVSTLDDKACGSPGLVVRQGDLRYHQINAIQTPQNASPWGIMSDASDPLTGEKVAASVNVWTSVTDQWSQAVVDRLRYIGGEISTASITEGRYVKAWADASKRASGGISPRVTRAELDRRLADIAGLTPAQLTAARAKAGKTGALNAAAAFWGQVAGLSADGTTQPTTTALYDARRLHAIGTPSEAQLDTPEMRALAGVASLSVSDATRRRSSPLEGGHPLIGRDLQQRLELALGDRGTCILNEAPAPTSLSALGDIMQQKFGRFDPNAALADQLDRAERMRLYIAGRAHTSVILHEMGHSVGLRHNFVSSADAWGYPPQYWQLRTSNGAKLPECTDVSATGKDCVGPRWFDPVTDEERDQLIWMFMQSSIMDYAGEWTQDLQGLGAYDFAAPRMFYGDAIAVHADPSYNVGTTRGAAMLAKSDNFGGILGLAWSTNGDSFGHGIHYSQLQANFDLIQDCRPLDQAKWQPSWWDERAGGAWNPVLDGQLVAIGGNFSRCRQQRVDYVPWNSLRPPSNAEAGGFTFGNRGIDPAGRTRVPYGFATDTWADTGNLSVFRHDNGADPYELFDFLISQQEVNHIFDNYRRGRTQFSLAGAVARINRYDGKMKNAAKGLGLIMNLERAFALTQGYDFETFWAAVLGGVPGSYSQLGSSVLAAGMAFDQFTRMVSRPEAGEHFQRPGEEVLRSSLDTTDNPGATLLVVPNGVTGFGGDVGVGGRPLENAIAKDQGEYNQEYTVNAGSYYEKAFASVLMTESADNFIRATRSPFVDARFRAVSLADVFPEGYRRWLGTNLTQDDALKAAWVQTSSDAPLVDSLGYPLHPLGWTSWSGAQPARCFPASGGQLCSTGTASAAGAMPIDAEVGWEQQKFLIAWTLIYLPENQQRNWIDMLSLWALGQDADPKLSARIELHAPGGPVYVAKTFGSETIFGKRVQKGIAARILEYANQLLAQAYETTPGPDLDGDGRPDWFLPQMANGQPIVRWDPTVRAITPDGHILTAGRPGCDAMSDTACRCSENRACVLLQNYASVPAYLRQSLHDFGVVEDS